MNEREQFEVWFRKATAPANKFGYDQGELWWSWNACAESKKSELDKANARIAQLEEALLWYVHNDDVTEGGQWEEINDYWLEGMRRAKQLLEKSNDTDTWLSQHDKAVEVKVLEELANAIDKYKNPDDSIGAAGLRNMAESIKSRK